MVSIIEIINGLKPTSKKINEDELKHLPFKKAYIYGRVSNPDQIKNSQESIREIARMAALAKEDGFQTDIDPERLEEWLISIAKGNSPKGMIEQNEVIVDVQDLGLSGQLSTDGRKGMSNLQRRIQEGHIGAVYITEGVSRLSRDRDRIFPYQLLKLLKEKQVRVRTPEGVWNPAIDRDWEYLADEFEYAINELKLMNRRLYRRKIQKASRGEWVGEPIIAGYILPIIEQKPNGEYVFGKLKPYPPHITVVKRILEEFVRQDGSYINTLRALRGLNFPFFPPELSYMKRRSALRFGEKLDSGYRITYNMIRSLATNIKLIGFWHFGATEIVWGNHEPAISEELFLQAYELVSKPTGLRGKYEKFEPMELYKLLWCCNHKDPRRITYHSFAKRYVCISRYWLGDEHGCLDIGGRFLNEPLTRVILNRLEFTSQAECALQSLETKVKNGKIQEELTNREIFHLEQEIRKYQTLLPGCVDDQTSMVDHDKESYYWTKIREAQKTLNAMKNKLNSNSIQLNCNFQSVKKFLLRLPREWSTYTDIVRNRILKLLIEKIELRGIRDIEATIFWKNGFQHTIIIHRTTLTAYKENRWGKIEDETLKRLFPSAPIEMIRLALPKRSWQAISLRSRYLNVKRNVGRECGYHTRRWTKEEDECLKIGYRSGLALSSISSQLKRSLGAVRDRAYLMHITWPQTNRERTRFFTWEEVSSPFSSESDSIGFYQAVLMRLATSFMSLDTNSKQCAHQRRRVDSLFWGHSGETWDKSGISEGVPGVRDTSSIHQLQ